MYNGSQPQQQLQTSTAWAAAWLTNLKSNQALPSAMPALQRLSVQSIAAVRSAALHPAVTEVLSGLALVPGMRFVLQCISSTAYARIVAGADLGIPLGPQQVSCCTFPGVGNFATLLRQCAHDSETQCIMRPPKKLSVVLMMYNMCACELTEYTQPLQITQHQASNAGQQSRRLLSTHCHPFRLL